MLGAITAAINSAQGRGADDVNAYEAVYGQQMDHLVMCTKAEARACWTLPDILKVTDDPDFQAYADENYFLADEEDNNDGLDDDGYFSDGSLPTEERDEVDDDFFFTNILEDISSDDDLNKNPIGAEGNANSFGDHLFRDHQPREGRPGEGWRRRWSWRWRWWRGTWSRAWTRCWS